jgi:hypothetical protein
MLLGTIADIADVLENASPNDISKMANLFLDHFVRKTNIVLCKEMQHISPKNRNKFIHQIKIILSFDVYR